MARAALMRATAAPPAVPQAHPVIEKTRYQNHWHVTRSLTLLGYRAYTFHNGTALNVLCSKIRNDRLMTKNRVAKIAVERLKKLPAPPAPKTFRNRRYQKRSVGTTALLQHDKTMSATEAKRERSIKRWSILRYRPGIG